MRREAGLALGALALAILGVAGWASRRGPAVRGPDDGPPRTAAPPSPTVPTAGRPTPHAPALDTPPVAARVPDEAPRALPTRGARIHGRVAIAGREGPLPAGSRIDVCSLTSATETLLRRASIDADGRYEVSFDPSDVPDLRPFVVYAVVPGWAWAREVVRLGPSEDRPADLTLGRPGHAEVLRGRVLDPADRPVTGLRLLLTTNPSPDPDTPLPDPDAEAYEVDRADGVVCACTTDGDGGFAVMGLADEPCRTESLDGAWYLSEVTRRSARHVERTLRARPGFVLEGRLTDAVTGDVLDAVDRSVVARLGGGTVVLRRRLGASGRFRWRQPVPVGGEAGFEVVFRWAARGFRSGERVIPFAPGSWTRRVDVALERLAPGDVGRLRLLHDVRDESGRPLPLTVLRGEPEGTFRRLEGDSTEYGPDGWLEVELPAGAQRLRVRPLGTPPVVEWEGTVEVEGARTTDVPLPFPPAGRLRVRAAGSGEPGVLRLAGPGEAGPEVEVFVAGDEVVLPALPAGRWRAWFDARGSSSAVTVEVVAGAHAEVVLPR